MKYFDRDQSAARIVELAVGLLESMAERILAVNLGIGIPTLIADRLDNPRIFLHTENGMLGVGPAPLPGQAHPDLTNAGRQPITETPGCCYFDSAESFALIRGGHIDATVIGAFEVDNEGHIANWTIPGGDKLGVGGAMDLVCGAKCIIVAMTHMSKNGPKLVRKCTLPLTAMRSVDWVITEYGIFRYTEDGFVLTTIADDISLEELQSVTDVDFSPSENLRVHSFR